MSDEQKAAAVPAKKSDKEKKPKKNRKSLGWIIGVVVLILISLTFVLPSTLFYGSGSSAINFGSYDGRNIDLTYDSYFYFQLQNYYNYYVQQVGAEAANNYSYNIYYAAFQSALLHEEIMKKAEKAGIQVTSQEVSDAIISSGYYSDNESSFSQDIYNQASDQQKKQIVAWMKEALPQEAVFDTYYSAKVSKGETDFITSLSGNPRNFEYIALTGAIYPDEEAVLYLNDHANLFQTVAFTRATYSTQEEATAALEAIASGTMTMDEAVIDSIDSSAPEGGVISEIYRFALDNYLNTTSPSSSAEVFAAEENSLIGPIYTTEGYSIYRIDQAAKDADPEGETTLTAVKSYITQYDSEIMRAYLEGMAAEVYAAAKDDFEKAADDYDLTISTVSSAAENPGDSQYIASFNYADMNYSLSGSLTQGYLYTAANADSEYSEKLFSSPLGTVLEPVYSNYAYVIVRPMEATGSTSYITSSISTVYPSYVPSQSLSDYQYTVLSSDKVEDNFISGFLSSAYGAQSSN